MGNRFDSDDIREMVYNSLPKYFQTINAASPYQWDDNDKLDAEICNYFDNLLMISRLAWGNNGGIATSTDIFQSKINQLVEGLDYVPSYLDNILIVTKNTYDDHVREPLQI